MKALPDDHPRPRAVLFDMDGLLFDSETLYRAMFFALLADEGLAAQDAHFTGLVGLGWEETLAALARDFPSLEPAAFVRAWKDACDPRHGHVPALKPGVDSILEVVERRGLASAIATGSQRKVAHGFLDAHGLRSRFGAIVAQEDCVRGKPHPEPFLRAAAAIGCEPGACLVLEDSPNGVRAARAAGIPAIFVPDMVAPDAEVASLALGVASDLDVVARWLDGLGT